MIIGLTGYKGSGKDAAMEQLVSNNPEYYDWARVKFAGCLKEMLEAYLRFNGVNYDEAHEIIEGSLKETPTEYFQGKTPRHAMQTLGTEWGRDIMGTSIWVDSALRCCAMFDNSFITDVRFPNEVKAIKDSGGYVIRITRPSTMRPEDEKHPSEVLMDSLPADYEIVNDGTLEELEQKLFRVMRKITW
jgi:hypothetical protein